MQTTTKHPRSGQALILATLALIPLFGIIGLAVDLGWMEFTKKSAQTAADAAAMAAVLQFQSTNYSSDFTCGAGGVICQSPTSCATIASGFLKSGCDYAVLNGFPSSGNQLVTMESGVGAPPTAPGVHSSAYWITVRVNQTVPQLFSAILGNFTGRVAARATAALNPARDCIYIMDPASSGALSMSGSTSLISSCGVYINSSNATALSGNGTPHLQAPEIDIVGGYTFSGVLDPDPPSTNVATMGDPLRNLPVPPVGPCNHINYSVSGHASVTLSPGVYCGGISVGNADVILSPGTYILNGGGLSTSSANSHISGVGVTLYNTFDATYSYAPINIVASSTASLVAPVTGPYAAVLLMEDRRIPAGTYTDTFGGGSTAVYTGIIYAPRSLMSFYGGPSLTAYTIIVTYRLNMVGNASIGNNYSTLPTGNPIKITSLVE